MKNWLAWLLPNKSLPQWVIITGFVVALLGFADASYLTIQKVRGVVPPCIITNGCDMVSNSSYSYFGPIPVSAVGATFYLTTLVLFFASLDSKNAKWAQGALRLSPVGFAFSLYFLFIQAFVLEAYCIYCLVSLATSTTLFGLAVYAKIKKQI